MYSLPGYIEKKRSELKIIIRGKNDPIMKRAVLQKNRLILNSKKIVNRRFTTRGKKSKEVELRLRKP